MLNSVVVAKTVYLYSSSVPIARNYENTTQQLRRNSMILPRRLNSDRYLAQDWKVIVRYLQLSRTA
jgi:hypothetical protein